MWKIRNSAALVRWAYATHVSVEDGVAVLEFVRDQLASDPDFGEVIDEHTRGALVPNTDIEAIWTFNPAEHYIEIIAPMPDD